METIRQVLYLDGYGAYVWPAFAVTAAVLLWMGLSTLRMLREKERALARLQDIRHQIAENNRDDGAEANPDGGEDQKGEP